MASTLAMQHDLVREVANLHAHMEKPEISFRDWKERGLDGSRCTMLAGWVLARTSPAEVFIDLRNANLSQADGKVLAEAMMKIPKLTSLDVRGNPELSGEALTALIVAMKDEKPGHPRSLCGVSPQNTRLEVPRKFTDASGVDVALTVAELEGHVYSESVTAGMGSVSGEVIQLNRRGGGGKSGDSSWLPLLWAAKVNHLQVGQQILDNGVNVNLQEKAGSGSTRSTALHVSPRRLEPTPKATAAALGHGRRPRAPAALWVATPSPPPRRSPPVILLLVSVLVPCANAPPATSTQIACDRGYIDFVSMLLAAGADPNITDVNGKTAKHMAEKRGNKEIIKMLEEKKGKGK